MTSFEQDMIYVNSVIDVIKSSIDGLLLKNTKYSKNESKNIPMCDYCQVKNYDEVCLIGFKNLQFGTSMIGRNKIQINRQDDTVRLLDYGTVVYGDDVYNLCTNLTEEEHFQNSLVMHPKCQLELLLATKISEYLYHTPFPSLQIERYYLDELINDVKILKGVNNDTI